LIVAAEAATHKAWTSEPRIHQALADKAWTQNLDPQNTLTRYFSTENPMSFVGHAFRHDIKAVSASGVLTPEALRL